MSLRAFNFQPALASQYGLLRRQDQDSLGFVSSCLEEAENYPVKEKMCNLMGTKIEENMGEIFNCIRKCKDDDCKQNCVYSSAGFNIGQIANTPIAKASAECASQSPSKAKACLDFCEDTECQIKCNNDFKHENAPCVAKKLNKSEDEIKEVNDCPEQKCSNFNDISGLQGCLMKCAGTEEDEKESTDSNDKSSSQSNSQASSTSGSMQPKQSGQSSSGSGSRSSSQSQSNDESNSSQITISELVTFGLVSLAILGIN